MSTETNKSATYPVTELKEKGKLILTNEILAQIFYLHSSIGKVEWSGILVYDVVSGEPVNPEEFVLKAKHIYLMDIGTSGATNYNFDESIVDLFDGIPDAMESKLGHIHSHHTMETFFSTTDTDELHDNVDKHNYYLSLIVNMAGNFNAKVAFLMNNKVTSEMSYTSDSGKLVTFQKETEEKAMGVVGMRIMMEYENPFFYDRLHAIEKAKEEEKKKKSTPAIKHYQENIDYSEYYRNFPDKTKNGPKPFQMTDAEVEELTAYVIAVDPELKEKRRAHELLNIIAKKSSTEDFSFYSKYLNDNLNKIFLEFFELSLTTSEKKFVVTELIASVRRFSGNKKIRPVTDTIIKVLMGHIGNGEYREKSKTVSPEELEEEISNLKLDK